MNSLKLVFTTICILIINSFSAQNYKVGDKVEAFDLEEKNWFPATVIKVDQNKWMVNYVGYAADYDIWLEADRLRTIGSKTTYKPYEYKVGERVEGTADKGLTWTFKAKVVKKENNRWLLHYDGTESSKDIIQSEVNMRPCPNCPTEEVKTFAATTTSSAGKYPGDGTYQQYDLVEIYDLGLKTWALAYLASYDEGSEMWSVQGLGLMWSVDKISKTAAANRLRTPLKQPKVIAGRADKEKMKKMQAELAPYADAITAFENSYNYSSGSNGTGGTAAGFGDIYSNSIDLELVKKQIAQMETAVNIVKEKYNNEPNEYVHYWTQNPQVILFLWENKDECIKRFYVHKMGYAQCIASKIADLNKINFKGDEVLSQPNIEFFPSVKGFEELVASFDNGDEMKFYKALNAKNPYDWKELEKNYRAKEKEYMAWNIEFSKKFNLEENFHNATLEALAKKKFSAYYPKAVILKAWLIKNDYTVRKTSLGIPEYKYNLVSVLCTSPDYKTQFYTTIDVTCDYTGGGNYGAPYAAYDKIMWAQRTYFVVNK